MCIPEVFCKIFGDFFHVPEEGESSWVFGCVLAGVVLYSFVAEMKSFRHCCLLSILKLKFKLNITFLDSLQNFHLFYAVGNWIHLIGCQMHSDDAQIDLILFAGIGVSVVVEKDA